MAITDHMHDLVAHFEAQKSYHDFEGLADAKQVLKVCTDPTSGKYVWDLGIEGYHKEASEEPFTTNKETYFLIRSLFLANLYERADSFGLEASSDTAEFMEWNTIVDMYELVVGLVGCRWWSKVTDEMIAVLEQVDGNEE